MLDDFDPKNYKSEDELLVTITLAEYRELLVSSVEKDYKIEKLTLRINQMQSEINRLKMEDK